MLRGLRRRWHIVLPLAILAAAVGVAAGWFFSPAKFIPEVLLRIENKSRLEGEVDLLALKRTEEAMVHSWAVLNDALKKPEVGKLSELAGKGHPVVYLQKNMTTDFTIGPEIMRLSLSGDNPEETTVLLNEIARSLVAVNARQEQGRIRTRVELLERKSKEWAGKLMDKREELQSKSKETIEAKEKLIEVSQRRTNAENKLSDNQFTLKSSRAQLEFLKSQLEKPDKVTVSTDQLDEEMSKDDLFKDSFLELRRLDVAIQQAEANAAAGTEAQASRPFRDRKATLLKDLEDKREHYRPRLEARARNKVLEESRKDILRLQVLVTQGQAEEKELESRVIDLRKQEERWRSKEPKAEVKAIQDQVTQYETDLKKLGDEIAGWKAELPDEVDPDKGEAAAPKHSAHVSILETAETPSARRYDKQIKTVAIAGGGMFVLVLIGFFVLEFRARRIYSSADLAGGLGIPLVGTMPPMPASARKPTQTANNAGLDQNVLREAVDSIRTVLLHSSQQNQLRVVMVTSAVEGEGKTSLASHLAASLARAWRKTLLIDCDLRNPAAHQQFDLPLEPGFSEVLRGEFEPEQAVQPTLVSRLWLMPAGRCDGHAIEALSQETLGQVFERLKEQFDFIILDACPVLPVADSLLVGQHADAALFAVMRDVSRIPAVHAAQQKLQTLHIRMLGAVVIGEKVEVYGHSHRAAAAAK
jgi:capsular exopolysaccharide synthesis family protein